MKICYLNHDLKENTGAGRFCLFLIKEMRNILPESQITVLTLEPSGHILEKPFIKTGVLGFVSSYFKVRRVLKENDIVHALDGWPYGFLAIAASLGLKKKVVITAVGSGAVAPLYSWRKRFVIWAYRKTDALTAVSRNTKKEILKVAPDLKIDVINHGVDIEKFSHFAEASRDEQVSSFKPYILTVGALKPRKGLEYSLKAFAHIVGDFPNLNYLIFGTDNSPDKTEETRLKNIAQELDVAEKVVFLSQKITDEELASLYKNAELFILLPQDINKDLEGFGLVFLEAAACGLPVVSASGTSAEDAVLNGQNGFLVPPQDIAAAGEVMAKILGDPNKREAFSKASREFAQKMTWRKTATQYTELYKTIFHKL